ncbi:MAG: ABC transporter permease [Chitinophagales bacterium]|nr:ABC transporter permease [Chitinophagales bacterium]
MRNQFKISFRSLAKQPGFTAINVLGLSIGLACCMLIALYIYHETHFDRHHERPYELCRLGTTFINLNGEDAGKEFRTFGTSARLGEALKNEFGEIESCARLLSLMEHDKTLIRVMDGGNIAASYNEPKGYFADPDFFGMFSYQFLEGNPATCLREPGTVVISDELAHKFFGKQPAEGRILKISSGWFEGGEMDFKVSGVFQTPEAQTQIKGRFFMAMQSGNLSQFLREQANMTRNNMFNTHIRLRPEAKSSDLEAKIPAFVEKHMGADLEDRGEKRKIFAVPMPEVHLFDLDTEKSTGKKTYLYMLGSIALFTLLIACVNFMNLSTARSSKRAAEVGARKSVGATQGQLMQQFLSESVLISLFAFLIALGLVQLALPAFNNFADLKLTLDPVGNPALMGSFLGLTLLTGLLAGIYPAFYLSSFRPVEVLKGHFGNRFSVVFLRKSLVVFQFFISAGLILASFVIGGQLRFLQQTDLGFQRDQQIVVPLHSDNAIRASANLKAEWLKDSRVAAVGATRFYPGIQNNSDSRFYRKGQSADQGVMLRRNWVDTDLMKTLDLKPAAGRLFTPEFPGDTLMKVVINEIAAQKLGFSTPEAAIQQEIRIMYQQHEFPYEIVGVVKDFHYEDLHSPIAPIAFELSPRPQLNYLIARAQSGAPLSEVVAGLESNWKKLVPGEPLEYSFLDEDFQKNYKSDQQMAGLIGGFTGIAILISCLGLLGLAAFAAEQRTKEIGIRKVLGASVRNISQLLMRDFLKLVLLGILIAAPVAGYLMQQWLTDFAYRIDLQWWMFVGSGLVALLIALLTVGGQSVKAALANPVKSLRSE